MTGRTHREPPPAPPLAAADLPGRLVPYGFVAVGLEPFDRFRWLPTFRAVPGGVPVGSRGWRVVHVDTARRGRVGQLVVGAVRVDGHTVYGLYQRCPDWLAPAVHGWPAIVPRDAPAAIVGVVVGGERTSEATAGTAA